GGQQSLSLRRHHPAARRRSECGSPDHRPDRGLDPPLRPGLGGRMMPHPEFFTGVLAAGFLVGALFFLRFWSRSRDGLFLAFALAFTLLSLQQALTVFLGLPDEDRSWIYLLRLAAFLILIVAILGKNMGRKDS